jgi:lipid A 3-O-deacylase
MKRWGLKFILSLLLLLLAGCSGNKPSPSKNAGTTSNQDKWYEIKHRYLINPSQNDLIASRFQSGEAVNKTEISDNKTCSDEHDEYYRPSDRIEKQAFISSKGELTTSRQSKKDTAYFRTTHFYKEPALFIPGKISAEVFFTAVFDNDIFDYTDYYYTNGISLELYHPGISASPICMILPGLRNSLNYYGLILIQNMYTPRKLEELKVRIGDRPFAAYLTVSHKRISLSPALHKRLESELALGAIGPASLGGVAQDMIHTNTPVGWVNQVKNDFVVNYNIRFDKGVYSRNGIEVAVITGGQAGTLYDNIIGGFYLQIGKANDRYGTLFQTTPHQKTFRERIRYYFSMDVKNKLVIYDATLQGGMFNRESVYKLNAYEVKHYVFTGTAAFGLGLGRYSLEAEQVFLTPEFNGGRHHLWFRIKNIFYLN